MDLKKIEGNVEKPPIENIESIQNWLEDDVEVEKPDFVLVQESADEFIKSLENDESNSFYDTSEINPVMVPEIRDDVPGFEGRDVLVCGVPIETGKILNYEQGNNMYLSPDHNKVCLMDKIHTPLYLYCILAEDLNILFFVLSHSRIHPLHLPAFLQQNTFV